MQIPIKKSSLSLGEGIPIAIGTKDSGVRISRQMHVSDTLGGETLSGCVQFFILAYHERNVISYGGRHRHFSLINIL